MSSSDAGASAANPTVNVNGVDVVARPPRTAAQQEYLDAVAEQAEQAIDVLEDRIAGLQEALTAAKAEAGRARAEAQDGEN